MKIINSLRSSLHYKVLAAFLIVGIVPYLLIILYFTYLGRQTIMKQKLQTYTQQAKQSKSLIKSRLSLLHREIRFLSGLELFDDMISGDIDRRISRFLEQKNSGLGKESMILAALDMNATVIASSHPRMLGKKDFVKFDRLLENANNIVGKNLLFFTPIKASFENRKLGYLVAIYPLKNLKFYIVRGDGVDYAIKNEKTVLISSADKERNGKYSTVKIALDDTLEGCDLVYSVADEKIFSFINRFIFYLTMLLLVGVVLIIVTGRKLTKQIVGPITELTDTAREIVQTRRYDLFVKSDTIDETSELAIAFNRLVETADKTLKKLDRQSALHMRRFIDLTEMFNHITRIDNKEELMVVLVEKMEKIVSYRLSFISKEKTLPKKSISLPMMVYDFGKDERKLYGHLVVDKEKFSDRLESKFFNSVVSMVVLQIERIELIEKIKSASNAKTSFISNMSHEFRTPLNAIIGFSQYLITYESMSEDQLETISKIERSALHLLNMINNILDIAKIEAGKIEINYSKVDVLSLLEECEELISPMAKEKNLKINSAKNDISKIIIQTDAKLLKQVIINLLSNAVKFTQKGDISINVKRDGKKVKISVKDTGIGIEKEELLKVFDEFVQLRSANWVKHKGTGLGLTLSLHIVHALGGELFLASEGKGRGTEAILVIP